jgi:hypothetical protein
MKHAKVYLEKHFLRVDTNFGPSFSASLFEPAKVFKNKLAAASLLASLADTVLDGTLLDQYRRNVSDDRQV